MRKLVLLCFCCAALAGGAHPRLFVKAQDFAALKERLPKTELGRLALNRLLSEAEAGLSRPAPAYRKDASGRRILQASQEALDLIGKLAMAYWLTGERRYAMRAADVALCVSRFPDWNPDHFLDTAEMTLAVALCYDWLYDVLTDVQRQILHDAILRKGLIKDDGALRDGHWVQKPNNWCQVCHGGLVCGAIALADTEPELARRVIDRAVESLPVPMSVFSPDGGFPEGPACYWPYALAYNALAIWAIEAFDGTDHGLCALPGFDLAAEYQDSCTGPTGMPFNFSDAGACSLNVRNPTFAQWWLAKRFNRPDTLLFCERDVLRRKLAEPAVAGNAVRSYDRFFPFVLMCLQDPPPGTRMTERLCRVIDGANPIAVMRTSWTDPDAWYAGLKGGTASASHGHMDVGSFVLDAKGFRWAVDIGNEYYDAVEASEIGKGLWDRNQDSPRWGLFRLSVEGHGTLQFAGERPNVDATAVFSPLVTNAEMVTTTLDLSKVYGRDVSRTFSLVRKGGFVVRDEIAGAHPGETVTWRMNTFASVEATGSRATLTATNAFGIVQTLRVTVDSPDVVFSVSDCQKRRRAYERDNPGLRQLCFERAVPASGSVSWTIRFN